MRASGGLAGIVAEGPEWFRIDHGGDGCARGEIVLEGTEGKDPGVRGRHQRTVQVMSPEVQTLSSSQYPFPDNKLSSICSIKTVDAVRSADTVLQ